MVFPSLRKPEGKFSFSPDHDGSVSLESAVFQALGAASVCWDDLEEAGLFHSNEAEKIGEALLGHVHAYVFDLTNVEPEFLVEELRNRGFVITNGVQWEENMEKIRGTRDGP